MIVVGLTGSLAAGKSTAAKMLGGMAGVAVFDSDACVHALYNTPEIIDLVRNAFPKAYSKKHKSIDRGALRDFLGRDNEKWDALEDLIHPFVVQAQTKFLRDAKRSGAEIAVLDIPLLFETGAENRVDVTICVSAPAFLRHKRALSQGAGRGMDYDDYMFRLSRQMEDREKCARADYVVPSGNGMAHTRRALEKIVSELKRGDFAAFPKKQEKTQDKEQDKDHEQNGKRPRTFGFPPYRL